MTKSQCRQPCVPRDRKQFFIPKNSSDQDFPKDGIMSVLLDPDAHMRYTRASPNARKIGWAGFNAKMVYWFQHFVPHVKIMIVVEASKRPHSVGATKLSLSTSYLSSFAKSACGSVLIILWPISSTTTETLFDQDTWTTTVDNQKCTKYRLPYTLISTWYE